MEMQLVTKKLSEIRPYERNPRRNDPAMASVMESIQQCTYVAPIVVDEDGVILAGHTRYRALKKLKRKEAEVIVKAGLTEEQPGEEKPGNFSKSEFEYSQQYGVTVILSSEAEQEECYNELRGMGYDCRVVTV